MTVCQKLRTELVERAARVQAGGDFDEAEQVRWFAAIVACRGWPGRRMVGPDGAHAAFVLAARCPIPYRKAWIRKIRDAVDHGDASNRCLTELEHQLAAEAEPVT